MASVLRICPSYATDYIPSVSSTVLFLLVAVIDVLPADGGRVLAGGEAEPSGASLRSNMALPNSSTGKANSFWVLPLSSPSIESDGMKWFSFDRQARYKIGEASASSLTLWSNASRSYRLSSFFQMPGMRVWSAMAQPRLRRCSESAIIRKCLCMPW